jgi:hypothetical protein
LYCGKKSVNHTTARAINDAFLIFDGAIVIDELFGTVDPFIFAAGPATKYTINQKTEWTHGHCSSAEVGKRAAWFMLHYFDPLLDINELSEQDKLHQYKEAKVASAVPFQGLNYFAFDIPKLPSYTPDARGRELDRAQENEFTRIRINARGYIESMCYCGPRSIPQKNLLCLYTRHEKYFNRLISRFDEGVIPDLISFLNETWALPLYHDKLPQFIGTLRQMVQGNDPEIQPIIESLMSLDRVSMC